MSTTIAKRHHVILNETTHFFELTTTEGLELRVTIRRRRQRQYGYSRNARNEYFQAPRLYVWHEDEGLLGNFFNRTSRPYRQYKQSIVPVVNELLGQPVDQKARWSQKAGCAMCPCSPGFILDHARGQRFSGQRGTALYDVSVSVTGVATVVEDAVESAQRAAQFLGHEQDMFGIDGVKRLYGEAAAEYAAALSG